MNDSPADKNNSQKFSQVLLIPLGCLMRSPLVILVLAAAGLLFFSLLQGITGVSFLGANHPDFSKLVITDNFQRVSDPRGNHWEITYESWPHSTFSGVIRHASRIQLGKIPLLTHDILVTSGDFADPDRVHTSVFDHKFMWYAPKDQSPAGAINLLHTIPQDETIFALLQQIQNGDQVTISGREILRIDSYAPSGKLYYYWQDSGCNSILVQSVQIEHSK